jgi:hypothetical protein
MVVCAVSSTSFILQPSPLNRGVKDVPEKEKRGGGDFSDFLSDGQRPERGLGGGEGKQGLDLGVTKRCRLFGLTNSVLVYSDRFIDREKETECGRYRLALALYSVHLCLWSPIKLGWSNSMSFRVAL